MRRQLLVSKLCLFAILFLLPAIAHAQPGAATLVSVTEAGTYTFIWNKVSGSTYYYLWVNEYGVPKHQVWYTAAQAGCSAAAATTCSIAVALPRLAYGSHAWWIQTYSAAGYGAWSAQGSYTSRPNRPIMVTDANGFYVGTLLSTNWASIDIDGVPTDTVLLPTGFQNSNITLFYTTANCSGTAYSYAVFPDRIEFTNSLANGYLRRGTPVTITSASTRTANSNGTFSDCTVDGSERSVQAVTARDMSSQFGSLVMPFKAVR